MNMHTLNLEALAASLQNGDHSIFGPSSSAMWLECSGSLIPNVLAEDDGNEDAAYGTVAHSLTEEWLRTKKRPAHMLDKKHFVPAGDFGYFITADEEMFDYAKECVDRCMLLPGSRRFVETKVRFGDLMPIPYQGGTLDFATIHHDTAYIFDHKFGSSPNNIVYAERNTQLMLYAWGLLRQIGGDWPSKFVFGINQPRLNHFDQWECSFQELSEFIQYVRERAKLAWQIDAPRTAGIKQCQWCKVKGSCSANAQLQEDLVSGVFGDLDALSETVDLSFYKNDVRDPDYQMQPASVLDLTTAQMARLRPYRAMAESWWKALDEELELRALRGEKVPGYKLVEARTRRRWANRSLAEKNLLALGAKRKDIVQERLISPAQAEKVLIAAGHARKSLPELLHGMAERPAGKPTLAVVADKRKEWVDLSESVFADLESTSEDEEL